VALVAVVIMAARHRCVIRWAREDFQFGPWAGQVELGHLPDGRWYVWVIGLWTDNLARLYLDEYTAREVARRRGERISGTWIQVPCDPTGAGGTGSGRASGTGTARIAGEPRHPLVGLAGEHVGLYLTL
jgi:hypothetical protein